MLCDGREVTACPGAAGNPARGALSDQADADRMEDGGRQRRGGDGEMGLERADAEPIGTGAHQQADDLEPGRIAELVETLGGIIEFHGLNLGPARPIVNDSSRIIELSTPHGTFPGPGPGLSRRNNAAGHWPVSANVGAFPSICRILI